jgi:hypothetical protein
MKLDMEQKLLDPKGNPFSDGATVGVGLYAGLSQPQAEDGTASVTDKMKLYRLTQRVAAGGVQEFSVEEIAILQDRASKVLSIIAFGALNDVLEGKSE